MTQRRSLTNYVAVEAELEVRESDYHYDEMLW